MKFSKLTIKNFRSIGPDGIAVAFGLGRNVAALVGSNASGKSNILQALSIILGVFPFDRRFDVEETDFHARNLDNELRIELHLNPPIQELDVYQKPFEIYGFRFRAYRKTRGDGRGVLTQEHYCFGKDGKTLVKPTRMYKAKKTQQDDSVDNTQRPLRVQDFVWKLGSSFYLDAPRLERFFDKTTGYTPLGRLFELYREDFPADHNLHESPDGTKLKSRDAFGQLAKNLATILRTDKLGEIEAGLSQRVSSYLGSEHLLRIGFGLPSHRELFENWVGLQVGETGDMPALPVQNLGSGHRALLRLAVILTLLDLERNDHGYILLVEEPEIYLHVHLRRYFNRVLRQLAEKDNQIILTTHSPEFVDLAEPHEIVRLHRPDGATLVRQVAENEHFDFQKTKQKVRRMGNEEMLFARLAILTEGQDDHGVMQALFQTKGIDVDVHSISIVNCDGADNVADYIKLCACLGIDFYVVHDEDTPTTSAKQKNRNDRIASAVSTAHPGHPSLHRYVPDLESTMGQVKHCGLDVLLACLDGKTYEQISSAYPNLVKPVDEVTVTRLVGTPPLSKR